MATTFEVFYLGTTTEIDPVEGDAVSDDANLLVGSTFGSVADPLRSHIHTFSPGSTGFSSNTANVYDTDNNVHNDTFSIDGGPDQTSDGVAGYNATITYIDGSTATITAVLMQDTAGNLYLLPEITNNADQVALEAQPIRSLTLDSLVTNSAVATADRHAADYAVCFTAGTAIRTPLGDRLIEGLRVGERVTTMDNGPQPIRWIGRRFVGQAELNASPNLRPVLIPAGRFGNARDLLVSRQHGLLLDRDHLVRAIHAARAPRSGLRIANGKRFVIYYHLMFDTHQIVFAEDAPSESYYPGPLAQRVLAPSAMRELRIMFPEVFTTSPVMNRIARSYGATARVFVPKHEIERGLPWQPRQSFQTHLIG